MPPSIISLNPPDMSDLSTLQPITFSVIDSDVPNTSSILAWLKFSGEDDKILIFDSEDFSFPFETNSTLVKPEGTDRTQSFSIIPEGAWQKDIEELRVEFTDEGAAGGGVPVVSNLSPTKEVILSSNFDKSQAISFDVTAVSDIAQVAVWARFSRRLDSVMIYETDGFVDAFAELSSISGAGVSRTLSLLESNGWRDRPQELFVFALDVDGNKAVIDVLA